MVPLIIAGAVAAGTLAASLYSSYKQGQISKDEYERKKAIAEGLKSKLESPSGEIEPFTFEEYAMTRQYMPEVAQYIEEKSPQTITEAKSQEAQALQRQALQQYAAQAQSGQDVIGDAQRAQAEFEAGAGAKSRRQQILAEMAQRGLAGSGAGGSGQELLAQLSGSQAEQAQQYQAGLQAAQGAEQRRLSALDKMANLSGDIRSQNTRVEGVNADIMNSYNQRLANAQNIYNQYAAGARNSAQQFNIGEEAKIRGLNTTGRNTVKNTNIARQQAANDRVFDVNRDNALQSANLDMGLAAQSGANARQDVANYTTAATGALGAGASMYGAYQQGQAADAANARQDKALAIEQQKVDLQKQQIAPQSSSMSLADPEDTRQKNASVNRTRGAYV